MTSRIEKFGLRLEPGKDFTLIDPLDDPNYHDNCKTYHSILEREGISTDEATLAELLDDGSELRIVGDAQ